MGSKRRIVLYIIGILAVVGLSCGLYLIFHSPLPRFPVTLTDQLGRPLDIGEEPQRIISLAPSNTETLFALGLGERVAGITEYCNYPEEALSKPKVGGFATPDLEKIVALDPDLILTTGIHEKLVIPALERRGFAVLALAPHNIEEVLDSIDLVGRAAGASEPASELIANLQKRTAAVTGKTHGPELVKILTMIDRKTMLQRLEQVLHEKEEPPTD